MRVLWREYLPAVSCCLLLCGCGPRAERVEPAAIQVLHSERWGEDGLAESGLLAEGDFVAGRLREIGDAFAARTRGLGYAELRLAITRECLYHSFSQSLCGSTPWHQRFRTETFGFRR